MEQLLQDARQAARALRHSPGFTMTALLTVALGVGAATAMFTVVNGVVLRPLPYPDAGRIVRVWSAHPERGLPFFSVSPPDAIDWAGQARTLASLGAFERAQPMAWTGGDQPEQVLVSRVTPQTFDVLAVPARVGRAFAAPDGAGAILLSHGLWQRRFGSDPSVVGRSLALDGRAYTVTGVMPPRFSVPGSTAEAWIPLDLRAGEDRARRFLRVIARVGPGATVEAARSDLETVSSRLQAQYPGTNGGWSVAVRTVQEAIVGPEMRQALLVLLGVVAFVLLIACANVANLVLVRGAARQRELAIRAALGAGRRRLMSQILAESAILAIAGGALGLALAAWLVEGLRAAAPAALPRLDDVRIDARVAAFAALASLAATALFGLVPAFQASRTDALGGWLRGGRGVVGLEGGRLRGAIVGLQVGLAVVVTLGSMLLVRSLLRLQGVDPGFTAARVTTVPLVAGEGTHTDRAAVVAFYEAVLDRVGALPGVQAASLVTVAPFAGPNSANIVAAEGQALERAKAPDADFRVVAPGYLRALGIPLRRGRDFGREDRPGAPPAAIVNDTMARRLWPGQDPIGRRFRVGDVASGPWVTVVGLAGDALYGSLEAPEARPMFYLPHAASGDRAMTLIVRATAGSVPPAAALRQAVWSVDKTVPVPAVTSLDDVLSGAVAPRRFNASLFLLFAGLAVVLSAVGVYGVMAHFVTLRRPEIGIRVALGATPRAIASFVLRRGGAAAAAGMAGGIAASLALGPVLRGLLYGVSPADPGTFVAVAAFFAALTTAAAWGPARRAMRFDPLRVLREG